MVPPATSQAQTYADTHRRAGAVIHGLADGLSEASFNWRSAPTSWSVAECVVHLNLVAAAYLPPLEDAVVEGARRGAGPFTYGFMARKMMDGVRPGGPALKTGAALDPAAGTTRSSFGKAETLVHFDEAVRRYVAVCEQAEGLDLAKIKVRYPFMRLLRLPLGAFLAITGQHALRHATQAEGVVGHSDFPT
ncbi:MAG: DinB family protein [Bacteroidota bacterium]